MFIINEQPHTGFHLGKENGTVLVKANLPYSSKVGLAKGC